MDKTKNINMKPTTFKEQNCTYAENHKEYLPLPAHKVNNENGEVVFCMSLSFKERMKLLFTGKLWCSLLTFNQPLTPSYFSVHKKDFFTGD